MKEYKKYTRVKILEDGTPVRLENKSKKSNYVKKNFVKKYISKVNGKYIYPKGYFKKFYTPVKKGPTFLSGKSKKMFKKNGKYYYYNKIKPSEFFGPPPPLILLPAPTKIFLLPAPVELPLPIKQGQRGPLSFGYYYRNVEKVLQKIKDKRKLINSKRPPLDLICGYCDKPFSLPGMNKKGFKTRPNKYCSSVCEHRSKRKNKLIPKWLYNYYIDKKLYHHVVAFKQSKYSIFSPKRRALFGLKNFNIWTIFVGVYDKRFGWFWNPKCFWRKKFKWLDNYKRQSSKQNRKNFIKIYSKSENFRKNVRKWQKKQPKDTNYNISNALRRSIIGALKRQKIRKHRKTEELLGTDRETARKHIESLFQPGMNWKNHGLGHGKWHIDHIIPCASFDLKCPVQQLACCHYKNLQPLWAIDNIKKGAKLDYHGFKSG
tara:strand:+ start:101 stop:1390 length:1290 start_codon:yes stop_codon:yes gene_type:complete